MCLTAVGGDCLSKILQKAKTSAFQKVSSFNFSQLMLYEKVGWKLPNARLNAHGSRAVGQIFA